MRKRSIGTMISLAAIACAIVVGMCFVSVAYGSPTASPQYGAITPSGESAASNADQSSLPADLVPVTLSDEQNREMFARVWGAEAAASVQFVTTPTPLSVVEKPVSYATMQSTNSTNWGGYYSAVSGIRGAQCSFNVKYNTSGQQATWTGLGTTNLVLQTGIDGALHKAWTEAWPANPVYWFTVNNGDTINASVGKDMGTGLWYLSIYDVTRNLSHGEAYTGGGTVEYKADWIVEAPNGNGSCGNFGTINFTGCKWWNSAGTLSNMNAGTGTYYRITLINNANQTIFTPGAISGGTAFSVAH